MTIFAVLVPDEPQPGVEQAIQAKFPNDHLRVGTKHWLISANLSAVELTAQLGIYDGKNPGTPSVGNAIVFATSAYYGRAPGTVWDWMKSKLEGVFG